MSHGVAEVCVMSPHTVTDADTVQDALTGELPDENTQQGYHRQLAYIRCECGEQFNGRGHARKEFEEHLTELA